MSSPNNLDVTNFKGMKGLNRLREYSSLSDAEKQEWLDTVPTAKERSPLEQGIIYKNRQFIDYFNQNPLNIGGKEYNGDALFDVVPWEDRNKMFHDAVVQEDFTSQYSGDKQFGFLNRVLSLEDKESALRSGIPSDKEIEELDNKFKAGLDAIDEKWWVHLSNTPGNIVTGEIGTKEAYDDYVNKVKKDKAKAVEKLITDSTKRMVEESAPQIDEIQNAIIGKQQSWLQASNLLDEVTKPEDEYSHDTSNDAANGIEEQSVSDVADYMVAAGLMSKEQRENFNAISEDKQELYLRELLNDSDASPNKDYFKEITDQRQFTITNEFGEQEVTIPGSNTWQMLKNRPRFKDFGDSDKLREYVTWQVLAEKYGPDVAIANLESSLQAYAHEHGTTAEWWDDLGRNVLYGGVANIMNKVNGLQLLAAGATDLVARTDYLENLLQGKRWSGDERKYYGENAKELDAAGKYMIANAFNPQYWSKADQYNTLDPMEMAAIEAHGGISPYVTTAMPGEAPKFFSTDSAKEMLKMAKFFWSDALVGHTLGAALGNMGTAGAFLNVALSGVGIAESYGIMTFDQTYQEAMAAADELRGQNAINYAKTLMETPENKKRIDEVVSQRVAQQDAITKGQERPLKLSEDEIRRGVEDDFISYYADQWEKSDEGKAIAEQDKQRALRAAAHAYVLDATIEELRMGVSNYLFRKYLFDKGTISQIEGTSGATKAAKQAADGTYKDLTKGQARLRKTWAALKPVYGGFESNYFDDVTVGLGKGFGIGQYNGYLQNKYDPTKLAVLSELPFDFVDGLDEAITGVKESLVDRQSFYDGFIGAFGTVTNVAPRVFDRSATRAQMGLEKGQKKTFGQWLNLNINHPMLASYYEEVSKQQQGSKMIDPANKVIRANRDKLDDVIQVLNRLSADTEAIKAGDIQKLKDAKNNEAFTLMYELFGGEGAPLVAKSQPIKEKLNKLEDYAAGVISEADIRDFLSRAENRDIANNKNAQELAKERLKSNAKSLLEMSERIANAEKYLDGSPFAKEIDPDLRRQFVYMLTMDETWSGRQQDIEKTLTGSNNIEKSRNVNARYGNLKNLTTNIVAQRTGLAEQTSRVAALNQSVKEKSEQLKSLREVTPYEGQDAAIQKAREELMSAELNRGAAVEALRDGQRRLKEMEKAAKQFDESVVLSAEEILRLHPEDREAILNNNNRKNYSEEQVREIDRVWEILQDRKINDAEKLIKDSRTLGDRVDANKKAYRKMAKNIPAALAYASHAKALRAQQARYYKDLVELDGIYDTFNNAKNEEELLSLIREQVNTNPKFPAWALQEYLKDHPNEKAQGLYEVSKLREDAARAITDNLGDTPEAKALNAQFKEATDNANNEKEAMSALENIVDQQTSAEAKLTIDKILEDTKNKGHQRDATKLRDRAEERKKAREAETKRLEEEAKKDGKNYDWSGYKVGDTVYFKDGRVGSVEEFEKLQSGANKMVVSFKLADGKTGKERLDSSTDKEKVSKEPFKEEAPKETSKEETKETPKEAPAPTEIPEDTPPERNPNNPSVVEESAPLDVQLTDEGAVIPPTLEQEAQARGAEVKEVGADTSDQGNEVTYVEGILNGNKFSEYSIEALKRDGVVKEEVPEKESSLFGRLRSWLNGSEFNRGKTKLQEIIDEEFQKILQDFPDTEVHFMAVKADPTDKLSQLVFNVIELTPEITKYHKDERGGVVRANGKSWLVVGTTGFDSNGGEVQQKALNQIKGRLNRGKMQHFNMFKDAEYYVSPMYTRVQATTSGRVVTQGINETAPRLRKVSELLQSAGLSLAKGIFGIQTNRINQSKGFVLTDNGKGIKFFGPKETASNKGRAFLMIETANGYRIPAMINPAFYNTLQEGTPLKDMIDETLNNLTNTDYAIRAEAIKQLYEYFILDKNTILIGKEGGDPIITIRREGFPDSSQRLGKDFDRTKFMRDLAAANFQINISLRNLNNPAMLKIYDDSGALMTNAASMKTAGSSYTVYSVGEDGKPMTSTQPIVKGETGRTDTNAPYKTAMINDVVYDLKGDTYVNRNNGQVVQKGSPLEISCRANTWIRETQQNPLFTQGNEHYYTVPRESGNILMAVDSLGNARLLTLEESTKILNEINEKVEAAKRATNREQDVSLEETPENPRDQIPQGQMTEQELAEAILGEPIETPAERATTVEVKTTPESKEVSETKQIITDTGNKSLSELQKTEKISTFVDVATSDEHSDRFYQLTSKWGITEETSFDTIEGILKQHNVETTNITVDANTWLDIIENCR